MGILMHYTNVMFISVQSLEARQDSMRLPTFLSMTPQNQQPPTSSIAASLSVASNFEEKIKESIVLEMMT